MLEYESTSAVVLGMKSVLDELLIFSRVWSISYCYCVVDTLKGVSIGGAISDWMGQLESEMQSSLRGLLDTAIRSYGTGVDECDVSMIKLDRFAYRMGIVIPCSNCHCSTQCDVV